MRFFASLLMRFDGVSIKKEFNEKIKVISFIHEEAQKTIRPINNIYWCYYLNVANDSSISKTELGISLTAYVAYVGQITALHEDFNNYYYAHEIVLKSHLADFNKVDKLFSDMYEMTVQIIKNHKAMNKVNRTEQNDMIIEKLKQAKALMEEYKIHVKQEGNIVAGS